MVASRTPALAGGNIVGGFNVVRELGRRRVSTVVAKKTVGATVELVTLERFPPSEGAERLLEAGQLLVALTHPNIVRVQRVERWNEGVLVVSDFVDAERYDVLTTEAARASKPIGLALHLRILADVLGALSALHLLSDVHALVHGEVCPSNILVGLDGNAKLAHPLRMPGPRNAPESIGYQAPEIRRGDTTVDARADIYSCGVMLWEALHGRRFLSDKDEVRILSQQLGEKIERATLPPGLDWAASLSNVATRALRADPAARFATAAEMAAEVRKIAGAKLAMKTAVAEFVSERASQRIAERKRALSTAVMGSAAVRKAVAVPIPTPSGIVPVGHQVAVDREMTPPSGTPRTPPKPPMVPRKAAGETPAKAANMPPQLKSSPHPPIHLMPEEEPTAKRAPALSAAIAREQLIARAGEVTPPPPSSRRSAAPPPLPKPRTGASAAPPPIAVVEAPPAAASPAFPAFPVPPPPAFAELPAPQAALAEPPPPVAAVPSPAQPLSETPAPQAAATFTPVDVSVDVPMEPMDLGPAPLTTPHASMAPAVVPLDRLSPPPVTDDRSSAAMIEDPRASAKRKRARTIVLATLGVMGVLLAAAGVQTVRRQADAKEDSVTSTPRVAATAPPAPETVSSPAQPAAAVPAASAPSAAAKPSAPAPATTERPAAHPEPVTTPPQAPAAAPPSRPSRPKTPYDPLGI